ncbi:MAG: FxsA family protein [Solirubrobacteraceae bacterium]|nr:MAG: hypothetical protein DLM63_01820 [Solirubrobacterales bacterium]
MFALLLLAFIVVPAAEIFVIIKVGEAIGAWPTVALLILDAVLGSIVVRQQGRAAWRRFRLAVQARRLPTREVLDGALVIAGGVFLFTPGFLTDIAGLVLILPPSRALVRRALSRRLSRRLVVASWDARGSRPDGHPPASQSYDVEGTAVDADRPHLRQ